jgi:hypothetical protein
VLGRKPTLLLAVLGTGGCLVGCGLAVTVHQLLLFYSLTGFCIFGY